MRHLFLLTTILFGQLSCAQCDLPQEYTNGSTGSNMTVLLSASLISGLDLNTSNPYVTVSVPSGLIIGSSSLAEEDLNDGMQSIALWADDNLTEVIDGALPGETLTYHVVDGVNLYELNIGPSMSYVSMGVVPISSATLDFICEGELYGCTDPAACNYNEFATQADDSCEYPEEYYDCDGNCLNDSDGDLTCDELEIVGCMEPMACNYNPEATDEGFCDYQDQDSDGVCDEVDNCVDVPNSDQLDFDNNGVGDACDWNDGIGIEELGLQNLSIYPNPGSENLYIDAYSNSSSIELILKNQLGAIVHKQNIELSENKFSVLLNTKKLDAGLYLIQIISEHKQINKRWIKL